MTSQLNFSLLDKIVKICKKKKKEDDFEKISLTWLLYSKGAAGLIAIGFFVIFSENVLDKNTVQCYTSNSKENYVNYVSSFCWLHGAYYVEEKYQGIITPCIVRNENYNNKPVTQYYLWLHYIIAFLFVLTRLPYWIWKRFYSCQIHHILKSNNSDQLIHHFFYYRYLYKSRHIVYSVLESLNIIFLLLSLSFTHALLNKEFITYGFDVISYMFSDSDKAHPACHIFPTEVNCKFTVNSPTGHVNETNFLCILTNNLFNRFFFFILWIYWILISWLSIIGIFYRLVRFCSPSVSKYVCLRKIGNPTLGKRATNIMLKSHDWFVFEELLDRVRYIERESYLHQMCEYCEHNTTYQSLL